MSGKSFNPLIDDYTHDLLMAIYEDGADLGDAMRELALKHADHLTGATAAGTLRLDGCPRCNGRVITGDRIAVCAAGCGWRKAIA